MDGGRKEEKITWPAFFSRAWNLEPLMLLASQLHCTGNFFQSWRLMLTCSLSPACSPAPCHGRGHRSATALLSDIRCRRDRTFLYAIMGYCITRKEGRQAATPCLGFLSLLTASIVLWYPAEGPAASSILTCITSEQQIGGLPLRSGHTLAAPHSANPVISDNHSWQFYCCVLRWFVWVVGFGVFLFFKQFKFNWILPCLQDAKLLLTNGESREVLQCNVFLNCTQSLWKSPISTSVKM